MKKIIIAALLAILLVGISSRGLDIYKEAFEVKKAAKEAAKIISLYGGKNPIDSDQMKAIAKLFPSELNIAKEHIEFCVESAKKKLPAENYVIEEELTKCIIDLESKNFENRNPKCEKPSEKNLKSQIKQVEKEISKLKCQKRRGEAIPPTGEVLENMKDLIMKYKQKMEQSGSELDKLIGKRAMKRS